MTKQNNTVETTESASDELLRQYRLESIERQDGRWDVASKSGSTYQVRSVTRLDDMGCMYFQWRCSCPARKRCRHIDAVEQLSWEDAAADEDYDGMDVLERYE